MGFSWMKAFGVFEVVWSLVCCGVLGGMGKSGVWDKANMGDEVNWCCWSRG
jgi:hypothetical protein